MAVNYSGVEYDPEFYRDPNESMVEYMNRLPSVRSAGVLGSDATVVDPVANEVVDESLGEVSYSCPVGYVWNGKACVPSGDSGEGEATQTKPATLQQMIDAETGRTFDPAAIFGLFGPIGTALAGGAKMARRSALEDALIESGMTPEAAKMAMKDPEYVAQQIYSGRVGDIKDVEGRYDPNAANKWNPIGGIVDSLFGVGGMFGAKAVPKNSEYVFEGGGYEYVPAPVLPTAAAVAGMGLQQGMLGGMGAEGNRQYYITSDGQVRDVSALSDATQAGLKATAANRSAGSTSSGYDPTMAEDYGGDDSSSETSSSGSPSWASDIGSWF